MIKVEQHPNPHQTHPAGHAEPQTSAPTVEIEEDDEDMTVEDVATDNEARIDALVDLLVKKGIITEEEFDRAYDEQYEEDDDDDEAAPSETPQSTL